MVDEHEHHHRHDDAHDDETAQSTSHDHDHTDHDGHDHEGHAHDQEHDHQHKQLSPEEYATALRAAKDAYMKDDPSSPVQKAERAAFTGLAYYPYNPALAFELRLERDTSSETVEMGTSTGASREYPRAGTIHFTVNGEPAELTIFGEKKDLFLPIRDATSGTATYGAGRYLEPDTVGEDTVFVDFNLLYNPYCAYSEQFSCPLPPVENWLKVPIEAGEQTYQHPRSSS